MKSFQVCTQDLGHHSGIRALSSTPVERTLSIDKFHRSPIQSATMRVVPVVEDDNFDQFVEEEEVIYVNDGFQISRDKDGYFYDHIDYE